MDWKSAWLYPESTDKSISCEIVIIYNNNFKNYFDAANNMNKREREFILNNFLYFSVKKEVN